MFKRLQDLRRSDRKDSGFTLIELLIVVAIIGIIAAILIPNLLDALQKAKQKRTIADMKLTGTAWMSWFTDQISAAAAGQGTATFSWNDLEEMTYTSLRNELTPRYTAEVPRVDGWKYEFEYAIDPDLTSAIPMAIRARGVDNEFDGDSYEIKPFISTDYAKDIVWAGGFFVQWPNGLQ